MTTRRSSWLFPLAPLLLFAACEGAVPPARVTPSGERGEAPPPVVPAQTSQRPPDAFADLNKAARDAYAGARTRILARVEPILYVRFDELFLYYKGKEHTTGARGATPVSPRMHRLKAVSHAVALGTYPALFDCAQVVDAGRSDGWNGKKAELETLKARIAAARAALDGAGFEGEEKVRQERILATTQSFLERVITAGQCPTTQALSAFVRGQRADLALNTTETARIYLDHLQSETQALLGKFPELKRENLTVIVSGTQLPRAGNAATQYFARLLDLPGEGPRLIYAESLWTSEPARALLGTHRLDQVIGSAFFDDAKRMHRDVLADDAAQYIPVLLEALNRRAN